MSDYHDPLHSTEGQSLKVHGHEVTLMSSCMAKILIRVPWPKTIAPTLEQKEFVMNHTQSVVNYMLNEGMLSNSGGGIAIMVFTQHD